MVGKKSKNATLIQSAAITLVIITLLILSGPIAEAVKITLSADKNQVRAGDLPENRITFTAWGITEK